MEPWQDILDFWFEGINDSTTFNWEENPFKKWFVKDPQFDQQLKEKFEARFEKARDGEFKEWEGSPRGRLALFILLDQLPRNMFRDTAGMFATDDIALALTLKSISDRFDQELELVERIFCYLPLQHAEDIQHQKLSLRVYEDIVETSRTKCPQNTAFFESTLNYADKHLKVIEQFGRFPHRNILLGRESTKDEEEFLSKPGSSF